MKTVFKRFLSFALIVNHKLALTDDMGARKLYSLLEPREFRVYSTSGNQLGFEGERGVSEGCILLGSLIRNDPRKACIMVGSLLEPTEGLAPTSQLPESTRNLVKLGPVRWLSGDDPYLSNLETRVCASECM